jgi:hypothetical protein
MSHPATPDDADLTPLARIAEHVVTIPRDAALWREAAILNAAQRPLAVALACGQIDWVTYHERLRVVAGPVLAQNNQTATEILVAATVLLMEAAPLPDSLN